MNKAGEGDGMPKQEWAACFGEQRLRGWMGSIPGLASRTLEGVWLEGSLQTGKRVGFWSLSENRDTGWWGQRVSSHSLRPC